MNAYSFNDTDLMENKRGKITQRQKILLDQYLRITRLNSQVAMLVTAASLLFLIIVFIFSGDGSSMKQALPYVAGVIFIVLVLTGTSVRIGLNRLRTLEEKQVQVRAGKLRLETKKLDYGTLKAYYAWIDDFRFQLASAKQVKALQNERGYKIYYIHYPPTHIILSLEMTG